MCTAASLWCPSKELVAALLLITHPCLQSRDRGNPYSQSRDSAICAQLA
jgi:hypothetical protein